MGIFNSFGAMSGQFAAKQERGKVAEALIQELKEPGKVAELLHSLHENGLGTLVREWVAGEKAPVTVAQLQQGLKQSTLLGSSDDENEDADWGRQDEPGRAAALKHRPAGARGDCDSNGEASDKVLDDSMGSCRGASMRRPARALTE